MKPNKREIAAEIKKARECLKPLWSLGDKEMKTYAADLACLAEDLRLLVGQVERRAA